MSKPTNGDFFNQGRKVLRDTDGTPGAITARDGDRYVITWDDGAEGFAMASSLEAADAAHILATHKALTIGAIIHTGQSRLNANQFFLALSPRSKRHLLCLHRINSRHAPHA